MNIFKRFAFSVSRGAMGITEHRRTHAAPLCIVTASLLILGVFSLIWSNALSVLKQIQSQYEITVYVSESVPKDWVFVIGEALTETEGISECRFYSKEARMADKKHIAVADVYKESDEYKAMRDSYIIKLSDTGSTENILEKVRDIDGVEEVQNLGKTADQLTALISILQKVDFWIMPALALVALIMIVISIKLGIYARRDEISIMRCVGATNGFIGFPYVIEGMLIGLIGSILSVVLVMWGYSVLTDKIGEILTETTILPIPFIDAMRHLVFTIIPLGTGIGLFGSLFSVRKYLKKQTQTF